MYDFVKSSNSNKKETLILDEGSLKNTTIVGEVFCSKCGNKISIEDAFCNGCGAKNKMYKD